MNASDLDDLAPVIGYRATRIIAAWFAGRYLHVPMRALESHPLRELIGRAAFEALTRECPGERFHVPTTEDDDHYRRDRAIAERFAAGHNATDIAAGLRLSVRRIEQIRAELVSLGWLRYAQGFDTAKAAARRTRAPAALAAFPEFIGATVAD